MILNVKNVNDVAKQRLCIGCGVCESVCSKSLISLRDFVEEGIRPIVEKGQCESCNACLDVCPGIGVRFNPPDPSHPFGANPEKIWGPLLEIWEGYATDENIRYKGSSGGALTALAAYCLENEKMTGVLQTGQDPKDPVQNRTRLSRNREHLFKAMGSRYSPASIGNGLNLVRNAEGCCAIIGKPSEIAGIRKAMDRDIVLREKVGVLMSFFCAETPATKGTIELLKKMNYDHKRLASLRYRGEGWPGHFTPVAEGEREPREKLAYRKTWAYLRSYLPWATNIWLDGSGELADISCGDPWYELPDGKNPGFSLLVVRTERGRKIVQGAIKAGYLTVKPAELWKLEKSQGSISTKKGAVGGRLTAMRIMGLATPNYSNANLLSCWMKLPFSRKLRSLLGTIRRIVKRNLKQPLQLDSDKSVKVKPALDANDIEKL